MAPVLGSSPAQHRSVTPPQQRGSFVPFVRPARQQRSSFDVADTDGSFKGEAGTLPARRFSAGFGGQQSWSSTEQRIGSPARSAPQKSSAGNALRRSSDHCAPQLVQRGFAPSSGRPPTSPSSQTPRSSAATGMLSRQLSQTECPGPNSQRQPSQTELQAKLEKCLDRAAVTPPSETAKQPADPELLSQLRARHPVFSAPVVARAFSVAAAAAASAAKLEACACTAAILAELGLDADTVAAGLLHDALDASPLTRVQLEQLTPPAVSEVVGNVSRISTACQLLQADRTSQASASSTSHKLTTMLLAMADVRAVLVVLAARLQRLRSAAASAAAGVVDLRAEAWEGLHVFAPLANRLGVWSLKAELEDLCFMVLDPLRAKELRDTLAKPQSRSGLAAALTELKGRLDAQGVVYEDLSGRPKNLYGVASKLARKGADADVSQVYDVRALRLIVSSKQDCYSALREVEALWQPVPGRFKDYVRKPKANGYQSLHTVVRGSDGLPIEVQIRTAKMHYIAEYGIAAHWRYKEQLASDGGHTDQLVGWARWLITWQLELEDGKCRPRGSPPRDTSLASLFPAAAAAKAGDQQQPHASGCTFPEHAPDCKFTRYVHSEKFAPRTAPPDADTAPVYIVLLNAATAAAAAEPAAQTPAPQKAPQPAASTVQPAAGGGRVVSNVVSAAGLFRRSGGAAAAAAKAAAAASAGNTSQEQEAAAAAPVAAERIATSGSIGTTPFEAAIQRAHSSKLRVSTPAVPTPRIEELPAGTSVASILAGDVPGVVPSLPARGVLRVLVNHEEVTDVSAPLRHGDKVEIFDADSEELPQPSPQLRCAISPPTSAGSLTTNVVPLSSPSRPIPASPRSPAALAAAAAAATETIIGFDDEPPLATTATGGANQIDGLPLGADGVTVLARPRMPWGGTAGSRSGSRVGSGANSPAADATGLAASPAGETVGERAHRIDKQRRALYRAFSGPAAELEVELVSRTPSERLEEIMARPDFLPPELRGTPVAI